MALPGVEIVAITLAVASVSFLRDASEQLDRHNAVRFCVCVLPQHSGPFPPGLRLHYCVTLLLRLAGTRRPLVRTFDG